MRRLTGSVALAALVATVAVAAISLPGAAAARRAGDGGTLQAAIADNPDHLDSGLSYATEGWETLEATGNGLLTFQKASGAAGSKIVPDLAVAMPTVSDGGKTYSFTMRTGVRFSPPVNRAVEPSDIKFSIERLFRIDSGGVGFYTGIVGANQYAKTKKGGISGIVANDQTHTIVFHLTAPDGTFLDYVAIPFAFAMPKGTPDKDISTDAAWRVATGPYMITSYIPKQSIVLKRNPNFKQWSPNSPNGHLDEIDIKIGVDPETAVNETADGQLDWYFGAVPGDRLTQLKAQYPKQVYTFDRNNITYFEMNHRKPPFDKLAVRRALNFATDRNALVKIFGGQGIPTENIVPPGLGAAYKKHTFYPYNLAKAKALVKASGDVGMAVTVWSHSTDPVPKAAEYMAGVLDSLGFKASVKTLDESVYWDTISTEKGDPQIAFVQFDQDYPEAQDFIDVQLNGEHIVNVGNQVHSNVNIPALNKRIDAARELPFGPKRDAAWAALDAAFMQQDAPWVPFMFRQLPKFVSARLHNLVFNGTYYELFPSMELSS
jgi:peptide/nickel transport system substrate-binding protein